MKKYGIRVLKKSTGALSWCRVVFLDGSTKDLKYNSINEAFKDCNNWYRNKYFDYWVEEYKEYQRLT